MKSYLLRSVEKWRAGVARYAPTILILWLFILPVFAQEESTSATITAENVDSLAEVLVIQAHDMPVNDVAFSPDDSLVVSAGDDIAVRVWDIANNVMLSEYTHLSFARSVNFSPIVADNGEFTLASSSWGRNVIVSTVTPLGAVEELSEIEGFNAILEDVVFTPDGESVAVGVGDGTIQLVDLATQAQTTFAMSALKPGGISISPEGNLLAAASGFPENTVVIWDIAESEEPMLAVSAHDGTPTAVAFSPVLNASDLITLTSAGDDGLVNLWWLTTDGELVNEQRIQLTGEWLTDVAFSPDGALLAVGTLTGRAYLWDVSDPESPEQLATLEVLDESINALAFNPGGTQFAFAGNDGTIHIWGLEPEE